jgi:hypothetical protein
MKSRRGAFRTRRHEQLLQERIHDSYKARGKLPDPTRCPDCGALFRRGRWTWGSAPAQAHKERCPACLRIRDDFPAGYLSLHGTFFDSHRDEVLSRVRHCEEAEKRDHPLERIMQIRLEGSRVVVTTTDTHLVRRMGDALHDAYKGELAYRYNKAQNLLRVDWSR